MTSYLVRWEIDVEARNPTYAALEALRVQRDNDPANVATIFEVWASDTQKPDVDAPTTVDTSLAIHCGMKVLEPTVGIVVNAAEVFKRADFREWLDQPSGVATWKQVGAKPDEYSDVFVLVDSNYEGDSSDMPDDIWRSICDLAYAKYCNGKPELSLLHSHIVVRLTNLS